MLINKLTMFVNSNADYDQDDTQRAIGVKIQQIE
jgi:hypothetical protein